MIIDPALVIVFVLSVSAVCYVAIDSAYLNGMQDYVAEQADRGANIHEAQRHIEEVCSSLSGPLWGECALDAMEAYQKQSEDTRDLHAQEWMAHWAFWMFTTAFAGTLVALYGLVLLRRTWVETQKATSIAEKGVGATLNAAKKSSQAYVIIEKAEAVFREAGPMEIGSLSIADPKIISQCIHLYITLTLSNIGNSPSRSVRVSMGSGEAVVSFSDPGGPRRLGGLFRTCVAPDSTISMGRDRSEAVTLHIRLDRPVGDECLLDNVLGFALLNVSSGSESAQEKLKEAQDSWLSGRAFPGDKCRWGGTFNVTFDNFFDELPEVSAATLLFSMRMITIDEPFAVEVRQVAPKNEH
ncbi:hypothetical protein [Pseudotabrizicola sp. 4114]|uniref:hypothetical protein n=1 Tax=Pseudotabrizicola sp. 4114 TaxID=2817731 RepID=UPI0032B73897